MKKKMIVLLTGILAASIILSGCAASKGLETDDLAISMYKGVEVDAVDKPEEVTDEKVDETIEATLQANATTKEITDRAVQKGDTATIDFVGKMDGEEFEGGSSTDYPLEIGSGQFIEGFEDSVVGLRRFLFEILFIDSVFAVIHSAAACQHRINIFLRNSKSGGFICLRFCYDFLLFFDSRKIYA